MAGRLAEEEVVLGVMVEPLVGTAAQVVLWLEVAAPAAGCSDRGAPVALVAGYFVEAS